MAAAAVESSCAAAAGGSLDTAMKLLCSHGGRLLPRGPGGALRYVGGETRVLVVGRSVTFRDLVARTSEMSGGAEVRGISHCLADKGVDDVLVSVTCDEELAHMRDEYDRLRVTRPAASFRVFVTTAAASSGSGGGAYQQRATVGLPPLAPAMRHVQSERAHLHRRPVFSAAPVRRVQSAQGFAGAIHEQQPFHHRRLQQQRCSCQHRDLCAPAPPPVRPMYAVPYTCTRK